MLCCYAVHLFIYFFTWLTHQSERLVLEVRDHVQFIFLSPPSRGVLGALSESHNIIPMNEWWNFTLNSDDQMQGNLKVHGTQEKNNEADYLMSMRKSIIFLLNKKKEKQRFIHFQVKIFHSFHLWFVLQGETNSKAVLCSVLGWCACCCFLGAVSAVDLNWIISFPCLELSWPWPGAVISFFHYAHPSSDKGQAPYCFQLKMFSSYFWSQLNIYLEI